MNASSFKKISNEVKNSNNFQLNMVEPKKVVMTFTTCVKAVTV